MPYLCTSDHNTGVLNILLTRILFDASLSELRLITQNSD